MDSPSIDNNRPSSAVLLTQPRQQNAPEEQLLRQTACGTDLEGSGLSLRSVKNINLSDDARHKINSLFDIINERLDIMPEMAQLKLKLEQPVLDQSREQVIMDKALDYANKIELDMDLAQRFIQTQMDIARFLQEQEQNSSPLTTEQAIQRKQELRDILIALTPKMLDTLKDIQNDLELATFRTAIQTALNYKMKGQPLENKHLQDAVFQSLYP